MLLLFLLISTVASVVVSSVLGVRLLRLASRTRELPELTIGSSFILSGVIGYVVMLVGNPASGAMTVEMAERLLLIGYALWSWHSRLLRHPGQERRPNFQ